MDDRLSVQAFSKNGLNMNLNYVMNKFCSFLNSSENDIRKRKIKIKEENSTKKIELEPKFETRFRFDEDELNSEKPDLFFKRILTESPL